MKAFGTISDKKINTTRIIGAFKTSFCGTKFLESLLSRNSDITGSASSMVKSPASRKLSKVCKYQEHN